MLCLTNAISWLTVICFFRGRQRVVRPPRLQNLRLADSSWIPLYSVKDADRCRAHSPHKARGQQATRPEHTQGRQGGREHASNHRASRLRYMGDIYEDQGGPESDLWEYAYYPGQEEVEPSKAVLIKHAFNGMVISVPT